MAKRRALPQLRSGMILIGGQFEMHLVRLFGKINFDTSATLKVACIMESSLNMM
jgi:hypothetical protein